MAGDGADKDDDGLYSPNLLQAEVRIVNDSTCLIAMGEDADNLDPETNICAGGNGRDTCEVIVVRSYHMSFYQSFSFEEGK